MFVLLTTSSLSTNPRLVKELQLLHAQHHVQVIAFRIGSWADAADKQWLSSVQRAQVIRLPATRKPLLPWLFSTIVQQVALVLARLCRRSLLMQALAHNKRTALLVMYVLMKRKKMHADLIICHTLGALYSGYLLARKTGARLAFDMEDYHPGEAMPTKGAEAEKRRREYLLGKLLPHCAYVSFAADGYEELTRKHITTDIQHPTVVYNTFPASEFIPPQPRSDACIRFIWFSQTLGRGRGLELFIETIRQADVAYEITLIGQVNDRDFEALLRQDPYLVIMPPMPQTQLHHLLSTYDIGLALELNAADLNRNYSLTNKLFAYLQAGLLVLATDTPAQQRFLQKYPEHHLLCAQNVESMRKAIQKLYACLPHIRSTAQARYQQAKAIAWENEQQKLIRIWEKVLR